MIVVTAVEGVLGEVADPRATLFSEFLRPDRRGTWLCNQFLSSFNSLVALTGWKDQEEVEAWLFHNFGGVSAPKLRFVEETQQSKTIEDLRRNRLASFASEHRIDFVLDQSQWVCDWAQREVGSAALRYHPVQRAWYPRPGKIQPWSES